MKKNTPKFSVKTIFLLFTVLLIFVQVYNGYEVYLLVDKIFTLFSQATDVTVKITNLSYVSEFYVALHETQPKIFSNNKTLKAIAVSSKKLPIVLLYVFFALVVFNYFTVVDFELWYHLKVGLHHILIHKILHHIQHEKSCKWYNWVRKINKVKRYVKKKFSNTKTKQS